MICTRYNMLYTLYNVGKRCIPQEKPGESADAAKTTIRSLLTAQVVLTIVALGLSG